MTRITLHALTELPGRVLGTWSQFADPDMIDVVAAAGYRFTIIDCEHGAFGIETAAQLIRACEAANICPLLRVPRGDHALAMKAMDYGCAGIVAPGVESGTEAQSWVEAMRFAPRGSRGACPIVRAAWHSQMPWKQFEGEQDHPVVIPLIETAAGAAAACDICAVAGLAGIMVGPFDLSVSLGSSGDIDASNLLEACVQVVDAAQAALLATWMPVFAPQRELLQSRIAFWTKRGVRHFPVGADKIMAATGLSMFQEWASSAS